MMNTTAEQNKDQMHQWRMLLLAPILWMAYFMLVYLLDEAACRLAFWHTAVWGPLTVVSLVSLLITGVIFLVMLYPAYWGWQLWQKAKTEETEGRGVTVTERRQRDRFVGSSAMMLSLLFALLTIGLGLTFLVLEPC